MSTWGELFALEACRAVVLVACTARKTSESWEAWGPCRRGRAVLTFPVRGADWAPAHGPGGMSPSRLTPRPVPSPRGRAAPVGEVFAQKVGNAALLLLAFISDLPSPGAGVAF